MSNTKLKGFTPLIDAVVQDVGLVAAAVYGVVWRHCEMRDKVCHASIATLSDFIGVKRRTTERHLQELCDAGYLHKMKRPGKPSVYQIARGVLLIQEMKMEDESDSRTPCVGESHKDTKEDTYNSNASHCNTRNKIARAKKKHPLSPETPHEITLFDKYNEQRREMHRRLCLKFPNAAVRDRFRRAAKRLDGNLETAIDCAFYQGINSLPQIVAYIEKWRPDGKPTYRKGGNDSRRLEAYGNGYETGGFATGLGEPLVSSEEYEQWRSRSRASPP